MFFPEGQLRVYVYGCPVDMRKSYDGLYALTPTPWGRIPPVGTCLPSSTGGPRKSRCCTGTAGFCVWAKRLEQGRFLSDWRCLTTREMDWTGLKLLLEGIEAKVIKKRYKERRSNDAYGIMRA